jgi:hypothetical protein
VVAEEVALREVKEATEVAIRSLNNMMIELHVHTVEEDSTI